MANLRNRISPLLALVALAFVVAVVWAGSALAAGDSSSTDGSSDAPAATQTQTQDDDATPQGDCPDRGEDSADDSDATAF